MRPANASRSGRSVMRNKVSPPARNQMPASDLLEMDLDLGTIASAPIMPARQPAPAAKSAPQETSRFFPEEYAALPPVQEVHVFWGREEITAFLISFIIGIPLGIAIGFKASGWGL